MTTTDLSPLINIIYLVLLTCIVIGGLFAMRKGYSKEAQEAMKSLNDTLDEEIKGLRRRVDDLERDRATQDRVIATIRSVLKTYNLRVTIQGDVVTINDSVGKSKSMRVQPPASVQPIKAPDDDDDAV